MKNHVLLPELSHYALLEAHASLRGSTAMREPCFSWIESGASWGNSCYDVHATRGDAEGILALAEKARELGCTVATGPSSNGGEAGQRGTEQALLDAGFAFSSETTGMILRPRDLKPAVLPEGYRVEEPASDAALLDWSVIVCRDLFAQPSPDYARSFAESAALLRREGMMDVFLCRDRAGAPLSASASFFSGSSLGGVYFVATAPEARRKGLGAALTSIATERCASRRIDPVVLHASALGLPVYLSLGYESVSRMGRYKAPPPH